MLKKIVLFISLICGASVTFANNLNISNVSISGQDTVNNFTLINMNVSWDNSWRTSTLESNWDAVWVFVKYRVKTSTLWNHATINYVNGTAASDGHTQPSGSTIKTTSDGKGVFLYANANKTQGTATYNGIQLRWNYGANGLADNDSVEVCVFGIEMVYVTQGAFYLGDGTTSSNNQGQFRNGPSNTPFSVSSENAITMGGTSNGNLNNSNGSISYPDDFNNTTTKTLPAAFPKGYNAFYCMKYEITQGQYSDFLNKLTSNQATTRYPNKNGQNRHTITGSHPNFSSSMPFVACNWIGYQDVMAYADWAGLRPMSDFEYEKACRGTLSSVPNEYAWGTTTAVQATGIANSGAGNETSSNSTANATSGSAASVQGPLRVGWTSGGSREAAGDTYYGISNMSDNVWEFVVSVGHADGRLFDGVHGNGSLSSNGNADISTWPGYVTSENSGGNGCGARGGSWADGLIYKRVSDRLNANYLAAARASHYGGRCVRTAP